jgi:predicted O-linked N-acetylglucosamine transferase (SPINDLY family)
VAYLSADFHEHPTAYLTQELFALHDRARFDVTGISFGPEEDSDLRRRLTRSFDRFIDVRNASDQEIAQTVRNLEIDIAVDLSGFSAGCRPGVWAKRPAPLQVNYLVYPGTRGPIPSITSWPTASSFRPTGAARSRNRWFICRTATS